MLGSEEGGTDGTALGLEEGCLDGCLVGKNTG
jgi:hypothetical protein